MTDQARPARRHGPVTIRWPMRCSVLAVDNKPVNNHDECPWMTMDDHGQKSAICQLHRDNGKREKTAAVEDPPCKVNIIDTPHG